MITSGSLERNVLVGLGAENNTAIRKSDNNNTIHFKVGRILSSNNDSLINQREGIQHTMKANSGNRFLD